MTLEITDWMARLAAILVFAGVIGFEREARDKPAGLRTHMLVGLGSAMFTLISLDGFEGGDPSRIAAGVVTGLGFIGAGVILREGGSVRHLTTAADLWVVGALGLVAGAGKIAEGAIGTVFAVIVLTVLRTWERRAPGTDRHDDP
jgi:putative Mg2+ transporter-C (MgtC) family protein